MKLKPLADRLVVKPSEGLEKTKSGIVLPDTAKEKPHEGEVVSVGPGRTGDDGKRVPMEVKEGQKVVYSEYAGTKFKMEGEEYLILREEDVYAILG